MNVRSWKQKERDEKRVKRKVVVISCFMIVIDASVSEQCTLMYTGMYANITIIGIA